MNNIEKQATKSLAIVYGLRMLGLFLIFPIFSIYAQTLPDGQDLSLVGWAFGIYGLTQAFLHFPFGWASDKWGRKPIIYTGLILLALGGIVAGLAKDLIFIIVGRGIQGSGSISAVITALVADLTREQHRTKTMAAIGSTIGFSFVISLVISPYLYAWIGMSGIFFMITVLSILSIFVVKYHVPDPPPVIRNHYSAGVFKKLLKYQDLWKLNLAIFVLHAGQVIVFMVLPRHIGYLMHWDISQYGLFYLPIFLISFIVMVPCIIWGERLKKTKIILHYTMWLMLVALLLFQWGVTHRHMTIITIGMLFYFVAFNIMEAILPAELSKIVPADMRGTAMGLFSTAQSLGLFVGAFVGGHFHQQSIFLYTALLNIIVVWAFIGFGYHIKINKGEKHGITQ